jgi:hypothetical protein
MDLLGQIGTLRDTNRVTLLRGRARIQSRCVGLISEGVKSRRFIPTWRPFMATGRQVRNAWPHALSFKYFAIAKARFPVFGA